MIASTTPILKIANESDAGAIARLVNRAYRPAQRERGWTHEADLVEGDRATPEQVRSLFESQSRVLILCREAAIVACAHIRRDGATARRPISA
jgi:hypothetical protein